MKRISSVVRTLTLRQPRIYERHPSLDGSDSDLEEYRYIVPSGAHVVVRDHNGNEIARFVIHLANRICLIGDEGLAKLVTYLEGSPGGTVP